jgi:hypothetical protein
VTLREFLDLVRGAPEDAVICIAEVDEAFAADLAQVEIIDDAKTRRADAASTEAIELANGKDTAIVLRW